MFPLKSGKNHRKYRKVTDDFQTPGEKQEPVISWIQQPTGSARSHPRVSARADRHWIGHVDSDALTTANSSGTSC